MKRCFKCGIEKPIEEFYKHPQMADGHLNKCIECNKKDVSDRYNILIKNPDWHLKERARGRDKFHRLYAGTVKSTKETNSLRRTNYTEKYPEKYEAKNITRHAITSGRLIKQPCEICGEIEVQAHHDDYTKPLDVRWLCIKHHNEFHVLKREKELITLNN